jgi:hypothetical protein
MILEIPRGYLKSTAVEDTPLLRMVQATYPGNTPLDGDWGVLAIRVHWILKTFSTLTEGVSSYRYIAASRNSIIFRTIPRFPL